MKKREERERGKKSELPVAFAEDEKKNSFVVFLFVSFCSLADFSRGFCARVRFAISCSFPHRWRREIRGAE